MSRTPAPRARISGGVCGFVLFNLCWATIASVLLLAPAPAHAYIPAQGTNQTEVAQAAGLNFSDVSKVKLQWYGDPIGVYEGMISYQLVGADSTGISKGALVHFSEDKLPNGSTTTPWIALVSCDANSTDASMEDDIFTLARDRGAVAALLYSLKSVSCYINSEYSNPANFDQVMDIFATQSLTSSKIIESQFSNVLGNSSKYYWYSPSLLNDSVSGIENAIINGTIGNTGYLFATLTASNATDNSTTGTTIASDGGGGGSGGDGQSTNTSLAMIILYAITGCVSALFCIVIISGAIRAIRHPERYGPRSAEAFGGRPGAFGAQSRARGLTRAILDTFPVVKFGRTDVPAVPAHPKDVESADGDQLSPVPTKVAPADGSDVEVELRDWNAVSSQLDDAQQWKTQPDAAIAVAALPTLAHTPGADGDDRQDDPLNRAGSSSDVPQVVPRPRKPAAASASGGDKDVVPDAIGRETCPICIVDFEEGDDLRVLPCEGHHRFHRECVDQWLLELSSSCPICRQDFQALQTMMNAGEEGDTLEPPPPHGGPRPISSAAARFSRYLRAARHRRRAREDPAGYDATNPPLPLAPRTVLHM
ncbi:hypothetical protein K466DRAFT_519611 [Polyporus arcularius HHB13444]|uniref:RING-type domain-containing protein n=1 Tax=Polyporus arcularius HHB13444 TaxID=1314778 RepID=A0A5C3PL73_9APHY|nr:hypothetical protein K466DRAFT_519611 [Polyporus arcularius HHB13444]